MERNTAAVTICLALVVAVFLVNWVDRYNETEQMYIRHGYTHCALPGEDYAKWVKECPSR